MAEKKSEKQVMDVSKPGKAVADASARPVIVGHKPQVQDPMVTAEDTNPDVAEPEQSVASPSATKKVIAPLSDQENASESEAAAEDSSLESQPQPDEKSEPDADETSDGTQSDEEAAVVDAVADQVGAKKKEDAKTEEDKKHFAEIEKLIAEKKYFVPIGKARRKRNRALLWVTVFLALIFVGLLLAIDAELLEAGFNLPFDFL